MATSGNLLRPLQAKFVGMTRIPPDWMFAATKIFRLGGMEWLLLASFPK